MSASGRLLLSFQREEQSITDATGRVKITEQIKMHHDFIINTYYDSTDINMKQFFYYLYVIILTTISCTDHQEQMQNLTVDFNQLDTGKLTDWETKSIWPDAELVCGKKDYLFYELGITPHPHFIAEENSNRFLKVLIPERHYGPIVGAQWKFPITPNEEYYFSYRVKFANGFDFVKGGKLPGLAGGAANSGGHVPSGYDGWSARMMFWENGKLSYYLYFPNQSSQWGERLYLKNMQGDTLKIERGKWHTITQHIKMNTPQKKDGIIQAWFDGQEAFSVDTILFRNDKKLQIDQIFYSVFMGGDDLSWTSAKDEYIYFDDFHVSPQKIKP